MSALNKIWMHGRLLMVILIILICIPIIHPFGLPISISPPSQAVYAILQSVPPGSVIAFAEDIGYGGMGEIGDGLIIVAQYLIINGIKAVYLTVNKEGPMTYQTYVEPQYKAANKTYGVDYVYLGFFTGFATAQAALADNIRSVTTVDFYGTSLDTLPLMKNINSAKDFYLLYCSDNIRVFPDYVRHWHDRYNTTVICSTIATDMPEQQMLWASGETAGYLGGVRGIAEFEVLSGLLGVAVKTTDTLSISFLFALVICIPHSLYYVYTYYRKKKEVKK